MKALRCLAVAAMLLGISAPLQAQELHGSIAFSKESDGRYAWGIAWRFGGPVGATSESIRQCQRYGGIHCSEVGWFRNACGALAIGDENGYGAGWGRTRAAAERDALSRCRAANKNCRIEVARCSDSAGNAGGRGKRKQSVAKAEPCILYSGFLFHRGDWSGRCIGREATGEGKGNGEFESNRHIYTWVYRGSARKGRFHGNGHLRRWKNGKLLNTDEGEFRKGGLYNGTVIYHGSFHGSRCVTMTFRQGKRVKYEPNKC